MEKKRTITFYKDLNEPDRELLRENTRKTPEELWAVYVSMRRMYTELQGELVKPAKRISISRPSWM
ncbi:MAG TPA: hypothetical protein VK404_13070 [Spirosoma sp.]|nr:hypothetical protein [Spirosoma sp.]